MLPVVLLTPLMLAAEPVTINIPEQTYDHRTQTSTYRKGLDRLAGTSRCCSGNVSTCTAPGACGDHDSTPSDQIYD